GRSVPNSCAIVGRAPIDELVSNTVMKIPITQTRKTRYLCSSCASGIGSTPTGSPVRRESLGLRVGDEPGLLDAERADGFVLVAGASASAGRAEDGSFGVADQHAARLRQELAL